MRAFADAGVARPLERWTSEQFGGLSNVYTKAVDGDFVNGPRAGPDDISPWLHRLFEGHTVTAAWRAVRGALPDDTPAEELDPLRKSADGRDGRGAPQVPGHRGSKPAWRLRMPATRRIVAW
jgi:hypothetical protein